MSMISFSGRPSSKPPEDNRNSVWSKLVRRAESCPKCGSHVCLISERILGPRSKFTCSSCGCISFTPLIAYFVPITLPLADHEKQISVVFRTIEMGAV